MTPAEQLARAIAITAAAFENKNDKGGVPYIMHCLYVMNKMPADDFELRAAAVMHDLVEDTAWTIAALRQEKFSDRTTRIVNYMTHIDVQSYDDYIKFISFDLDATQIKLADLEHNSQVMRLKGLTKKDFDRLEKYARAYTYLKKT